MAKATTDKIFVVSEKTGPQVLCLVNATKKKKSFHCPFAVYFYMRMSAKPCESLQTAIFQRVFFFFFFNSGVSITRFQAILRVMETLMENGLETKRSFYSSPWRRSGSPVKQKTAVISSSAPRTCGRAPSLFPWQIPRRSWWRLGRPPAPGCEAHRWWFHLGCRPPTAAAPGVSWSRGATCQLPATHGVEMKSTRKI